MRSQVGRYYSGQAPEPQGLAAWGTWGSNAQEGLELREDSALRWSASDPNLSPGWPWSDCLTPRTPLAVLTHLTPPTVSRMERIPFLFLQMKKVRLRKEGEQLTGTPPTFPSQGLFHSTHSQE